MKFIYFIFSFFILFIRCDFANSRYFKTSHQNCTSLDLRNTYLQEMRNQGKVSWCYAFTAADILRYHYHVPRLISAADIAISYNTTWPAKLVDLFTNHGPPHQTGFNLVALKRAMKQGYCPEEIFPSENWIKVMDGQEIQTKLSDAFKDIENLYKSRPKMTFENLPFHFKFKNIDKKEFYKIYKKKTLSGFYNALRKKVCSKDRLYFDERSKVVMNFKSSDIFHKINTILNQGHLVSLDYDSRVLENRANNSLKIEKLHTSSVVGRKWNAKKNVCEYLIKDSYGEQCKKYDPSYECENGFVWLTEQDIHSNMISIVFMKPSNKDLY